jgi:hypothetical protein
VPCRRRASTSPRPEPTSAPKISAESLRTKAAGDIAESNNYDIAANLAGANEAFTAQSTRVQEAQQARQVTQAIGGQAAGEAAAGFSSGGSAGDLLRSSASQGALARGVLAQQGVITEAGYTEQQQSFETMAATGRATAASELDIAGKTDTIAGQQESIADQQRALATQTQNAANNQATGDFIGSVIKGISAVASLATGNPVPAIAAVAGGARSAVGDPNGIGGLH